MTERDMWIYGGTAVWVVANVIVWYFTRDEWEFVKREGWPLPLDGVQTLMAICFWTIPLTIGGWWHERKGRDDE